MAAKDDLNIWAEDTVIDGVTQLPNKLSIPTDLYKSGVLRDVPVTYHHYNTLLYLVTKALKEETLTPSLNLSDIPNASAAQANLGIDLSLFPLKANNLSDLTDIPQARNNLGLNTDDLFNTFFDKVYPVGTIYENKTNSANPATYLGRGTWVAEGEGRVAIGAGQTTDTNGDSINFTAGSQGGEYNHTLTEAEIPSHTHEQQAHLSGGGVVRSYQLDDDNNSGVESGNVDTVPTGGDGSHNNIQPYVVYYRWRRQA